MWLKVIIVVAIIGGIIGYLSSKDGEKAEGAVGGCLTGGMGCAYIIFQIALVLLGIYLLFLVGSWLFG